MNYIELIKNFWTSHNAHSFNTTEIALYFYLIEVFNLCQWKNQIKRNNRKVEADLDISFNTLKNARNKLQQAGLIYFKSQNGNANVTYTLSKFDEVSSEVDNKVTNEVCSRSVPSKDKLNKTKLIKVYKSFSFDFIDEEFKECFFTWLEYKHQRRETYKTQKSLELCYKKLLDKSRNNSVTAQSIVEQSMANNWAGLFELKERKDISHEYKPTIHPALQ